MSLHLRSLVLGLLSTLLLASCATVVEEPTAAIDVEVQSGKRPLANAEQWDTVLNLWLGDQPDRYCDATGAVLLIDAPEGRFWKAIGVTSDGGDTPVALDDRFEIGSNTKSFTVALAMMLQEGGVWSMDDPLSKWLPEQAAAIPFGDQVTLRDMAGNGSGIWDYADPLMQPLVDTNDRSGLAQGYTPQELVDYAVENGQAVFEPGTEWGYSSTNFILLGMAVEAATGQSLTDLYQERIFDPLGMENSSYLIGSPSSDETINGYYTTPSGEFVDMTLWDATQGGAAGAIVSTSEDMLKYVRGLTGGALFNNEATGNEMFDFRELTLSQGGGIMTGYGLGVASYGSPGFESWGHEGQTPGFQTQWMYVPEADTAVVFLTNSGSCPVGFFPLSLSPELFGLDTE